MTKRKPQTRFFVEYAGQLRRLFSVREQPNGDLFINTHLDDLRSAGAEVKVVTEFRHSIHVSSNSLENENTVHCVMRYADGSREDRYLVSSAVGRNRFQPIYVRSVIHPKSLKSLSPSPKDDVLLSPTYDPDLCTMLYAIWITSATGWERLAKRFPFQVCMVPYKKFNVIVPAAFATVPSPDDGNTIEYTSTTVERRSDEHAALGNRTGPAEGAPAEAAVG